MVNEVGAFYPGDSEGMQGEEEVMWPHEAHREADFEVGKGNPDSTVQE